MRIRKLARTLFTVALTGCGIVDPGDCVAMGSFGLEVVVVDSTQGTVPLAPVTLAVAEDEYVETHLLEGSATRWQLAFLALYERDGNYLVSVSAPGYVPWTRSNVAITRRGHCDVIQAVRLTARLRRS